MAFVGEPNPQAHNNRAAAQPENGQDRHKHRDRPVKPLWRIVWVVSYAALTA